MSLFFGPKNHFFRVRFLCDHYALRITTFTHKIILLFFDSNLHKSRKNFRKWTSLMSKNEIDETFLGKFDAH
jgi:hypothetical protein